MRYLNKQILYSVILVLLLVPISFSLGSIDTAHAQDIEETAGMKMPFDTIIVGEMGEFSNKWIVVDNVRHRYCKGVMIFNPKGHLIAAKDLDAAEEVKVFINKGCARKVQVLGFAQ